jgi:hypothetical protein
MKVMGVFMSGLISGVSTRCVEAVSSVRLIPLPVLGPP